MRLSAAELVILGGVHTRHFKLTESDGDVSRILVSSSEIRRLGSCHPPILSFLSPALSRAPGLPNLNLGPALVSPPPCNGNRGTCHFLFTPEFQSRYHASP